MTMEYLEVSPMGRTVTDPGTRADIARWVVALRRAFAAETGQATGQLVGPAMTGSGTGYCCLGIWCEIATVKGLLEYSGDGQWRGTGSGSGFWEASLLPLGARLDGEKNPPLFEYHTRDAEDYAPENWDHALDTVDAAELNDNHGLTFAQIADVVAWSYGVTSEELATAEAEPRVPVVEGPEPTEPKAA